MHLTSLTVRNFRNLASIDVEIPPEGVVIIGDNGQGKTNFLETIYYLVLFRSMRAAKDRELVRFGEAGFFIAGSAETRVTAGFEISGRRKKVTVDGQETKKLADAVGVDLKKFAPVNNSHYVIGHITNDAAQQTRLPSATPVVAGGSKMEDYSPVDPKLNLAMSRTQHGWCGVCFFDG